MELKRTNRREFLRTAAAFSGVAWSSALLPRGLFAEEAAATANALPAMRAKMGASPIEKTRLDEKLTLLSGPGGNIVVLDGKDGKWMIDTFLQPAWPRLKEALDGLSVNPVKQVIDTHWHFDHTDNNASLRSLGAGVLAHENTRRRMKEPHTITVFNLHFPPSPAEALPTETFSGKRDLEANGEKLHLEYVKPAHTGTDIFIFFPNSNVLHCGDLLTNNGGYPFIDHETGGKIQGMIEASNHLLSITDSKTKLIPGHGPVSGKVYLGQFRDRLVTIHDRIAGLKKEGKTLPEIVAAKPLNDLDEV